MSAIGRVRQRLSYTRGYADGLRYRLPYKSPWWADSVIYSQAYVEGYKRHNEKGSIRSPRILPATVVMLLLALCATAYMLRVASHATNTPPTDVSSQSRAPQVR